MSEKLLEPIEYTLIPTFTRAMLLIHHRDSRRRGLEEYKVLKRNGKKPGPSLKRISEEFEAIESLLRQELPVLHNLVTNFMTLLVGKLTLAQVQSFSSWRTVFQRLYGNEDIPEWEDIKANFQRGFDDKNLDEQIGRLGTIASSRSQRNDLKAERAPTVLRPDSLRSHDRDRYLATDEYKDNILWSAVSLYDFNVETTRHEAGYPYLTYPAGEVCPMQVNYHIWKSTHSCDLQVFEVIAEKGELWLAVKRDDPDLLVGWIWDKHFEKR